MKKTTYQLLYKLKTVEHGSIVMNTDLFITSRKNVGHRILIEIKKEGDDYDIYVIDTGCKDDNYKTCMFNTLKALFDKVFEIDLEREKLHFTFNDFIMKKLGDNYTEKKMQKKCEQKFLQKGESFFGIGYCVGWSLYFLYQLYVEKRSMEDVYEELYNKPSSIISGFIFIWYDRFFSKVLS